MSTSAEILVILQEMADDVYGDGLRGRDQQWLDSTLALINDRWLARGDGVAIYRNVALDSSDIGSRQVVSFGSHVSQLEMMEPPKQLPDIGQHINWRYQLEASYRGERIVTS